MAAEVYRRRNLDLPWLTRDAIKLLGELVMPSDNVLEWGSGSSTAWLEVRARRVRSIEHDPVWFERVRGQLAERALTSDSVRLLSTEPAGEPSRSPYVRAIDAFADGELSVCVIDGEHRGACAREALRKLIAGGVLVLDDAHLYLDHPTGSPHSRVGLGPADDEWAGIQLAVAGWRQIWTSDGFSDTAFWIKP